MIVQNKTETVSKAIVLVQATPLPNKDKINTCTILYDVDRHRLLRVRGIAYDDVRLKKSVRRYSTIHDLEIVKSSESRPESYDLPPGCDFDFKVTSRDNATTKSLLENMNALVEPNLEQAVLDGRSIVVLKQQPWEVELEVQYISKSQRNYVDVLHSNGILFPPIAARLTLFDGDKTITNATHLRPDWSPNIANLSRFKCLDWGVTAYLVKHKHFQNLTGLPADLYYKRHSAEYTRQALDSALDRFDNLPPKTRREFINQFKHEIYNCLYLDRERLILLGNNETRHFVWYTYSVMPVK